MTIETQRNAHWPISSANKPYFHVLVNALQCMASNGCALCSRRKRTKGQFLAPEICTSYHKTKCNVKIRKDNETFMFEKCKDGMK